MIYSVDTGTGSLYVERGGDGPAVVLVPGGGGDVAMYRDLVRELSQRFTVITLDRRGNSRSPSTARSESEVGPAAHAADVVAILDQAGLEQAFVFGNSAGGLITLSLLESHPERVSGAVVHEAPVLGVLPDAAQWTAYFDDLGRIVDREGSVPAMLKFATSTMDRPTRIFDARVGRMIGAAGVWLSKRLAPKNEMNRLFGNADQLMRFEMPAFVRYEPDLAALREAPVRWAFGVGVKSEGRYYGRPAQLLSAELGVPCLEFPGGHLGYQRYPEEFARRLEEFIDG
ncbi:alpha/beta fold hydrolase [Kribbella sp. NPDC055071]